MNYLKAVKPNTAAQAAGLPNTDRTICRGESAVPSVFLQIRNQKLICKGRPPPMIKNIRTSTIIWVDLYMRVHMCLCVQVCSYRLEKKMEKVWMWAEIMHKWIRRLKQSLHCVVAPVLPFSDFSPQKENTAYLCNNTPILLWSRRNSSFSILNITPTSVFDQLLNLKCSKSSEFILERN